jgi:Glycosyl hydrolase catalytic core
MKNNLAKSQFRIGLCCFLFVIFFSSYGVLTTANGVQAPASASHVQFSSNYIIGVDHLFFQPTSFVQMLASHGLKWAADNGISCNPSYQDAKSANFVGIESAGINIIGDLGNFPQSSYCPFPKAQTAQQWFADTAYIVKLYPYIHYWQWLNEPKIPSYGGWTPQKAFEYLVPTYQAIKSVAPNDVLVGPTPTIIYTNSQGAHCDPSWLSWTEEFFAQKDPSTGLTAHTMLNYLGLHFYTHPYLLDQVTKDGQKVSSVVSSCLAQYSSISGLPILITETGFTSASGGTPQMQAEYYQQLFPFLSTLSFVKGVFAYEITDSNNPTTTYGLFTQGFQAKPAWTVFESYL